MGKKEMVDIGLERLLTGGKYLLPHRYFSKNKIHNLSEITNESIISFCESEGAGVKKVKDFLELLTKVYIENILNYDFNFSIMKTDFWFAPVEYKRFREYLREVNIVYVNQIDEELTEILSDIRGINKKKVVQILDRIEEFNLLKIEFKDLLKIEPKEISQGITLEPQKILESLVNIHNKERVRDVLYKRYALGETLEHIGEEYSLSRERIRQLQLIGTEEVNDYLKARKFKKSLKEYFKDGEYCTYKEFYSLFNEENAHYAKVMLHNYNGFYLFGELELIYFEDNKNILEMVQDIIKRLPSEFFLYDFLDYLIMALGEIGLKDISLGGIEHLITLSNYNIYGEYATKLKLNTAEILELIFKHYHKSQLKFNEDGFNYVRKIARKHLNYELDGNIRAFENRLRENPNMLLVDKLTFQHIENAKVSEDIIIYIGEALEEMFRSENIVNASQIFDENKDYLISKGISTKYKMYNLISIYFGDYYKVGRGNTLEIYKSDNVVIQNKEALLIEYINKNGGITFKSNIINDMSWPSYKIEDTISKSSNLVKLGEQITTIYKCLIIPHVNHLINHL